MWPFRRRSLLHHMFITWACPKHCILCHYERHVRRGQREGALRASTSEHHTWSTCALWRKGHGFAWHWQRCFSFLFVLLCHFQGWILHHVQDSQKVAVYTLLLIGLTWNTSINLLRKSEYFRVILLTSMFKTTVNLLILLVWKRSVMFVPL